MFKVGDLVEYYAGNSDYAPYFVGKIGTVIESNNVDTRVKFHDYNRHPLLDTENFKLAIPNIDTLIKRANMGLKALEQLNENDVAVSDNIILEIININYYF